MYPSAGEYGASGENGGGYRPPRDPERPRLVPLPFRPKPWRPHCHEFFESPIVAQYPGLRAPEYSMYRVPEPYGYHHALGHRLVPDHSICRLGYGPVVDVYGYHHRYVRPAYYEYPMRCYCEACTRAYYAALVPPATHAHVHPWTYATHARAAAAGAAGAAPAQLRPCRHAAARAGLGAHTAAIPNSAFRRYYPGVNLPPSNVAPAPINNGAQYACACRFVPVNPRGELPSETALRHAELSEGFQRRSPPASTSTGPVYCNGTRPFAP